MELIQNHFSHSDKGIDQLCEELKRWGKWAAVFKPSTNDNTEDTEDTEDGENGLHKEREWTFYVVAKDANNNDVTDVNGTSIQGTNISDNNSIYLRIGEHKNSDNSTHRFTVTQHCKGLQEKTEYVSNSYENRYYYRIEFYKDTLLFYWNIPSNSTSTTSYDFNGREQAIVVTKGKTIDGKESQIMFYKKDNGYAGFFQLSCYDEDTNDVDAKHILLAGSASTSSSIDQAKFNIYIPLCNTASTFYAPEVLLSIMTNSSSLQFGTTTINDKNYRVSGYFTILDDDNFTFPKEEKEQKEEQ